MRPAMILLPLLLLGGCSCQRHADDGGTPGAAAAADGKRAAPTAAGDGNAALAAIAVPVLSAVPAGADDEATVVRHYFNALARGDRAAADALWTGGRVSTRADDAALRALIQQSGIPKVHSLRLDSDAPIARDTAQPSRLREVPVRIRAVTAEGTLRYTGWYRLQPRADGSGWEIHGASLQPQLD